MSSEVSRLNKLKIVFESLFADSENTLLEYGADEPFYKASSAGKKAIIYSRDDYFSSALHEIAHWCIAGKERRKIDDFGYWYKPEGRSESEQVEFEKVEVKPQAIEWALSLATEQKFHFSADNLSQGIGASESFKHKVECQLREYIANGLPSRAQQLFDALNSSFRNSQEIKINV